MKNLILITVIISIMTTFSSCNQNKGIKYPETKKIDHVDEYFGTQVADPYRWLEDDMSDETAEWVKAQNEVTFAYLDQIPFRAKMKERLTEQWDYPKHSSPFKISERWMMYKNTGLQNQSVLYLLNDIDDKEGTILLDSNTLSEDGTIALSGINITKDGKTLIYSISRGGSDWREFYFMDIDSRKLLDDHLKWIKFSGITPFEDGVIYSRFPEPKEGDMLKGTNENSMLYFHKIGTPQEQDILVYSEPQHPERSFSLDVTDDDKYMFLYTTESTTGNSLAFKKSNDKEFTHIITDFDKEYTVLDVIGNDLYIITNYDAPNNRLISVPLKKAADKKHWKDVIPERDYVLNGVSYVGKKLIANYLKDAHSYIEIFDTKGKNSYILDIPIGSVGGFGGKADDNITFYSYTSYNTPSIIYKYDIKNNISTEYSRTQIKFDSDKYVTKQVFYESKDGTKVPMFLTYKKDLELNGQNPTLLYGYGGFNISLTPSFSISRVPLLENGCIIAVANLRGGGEYGEKWHKAGTLMQKQNVFDDCIAAAEYLIANNYTSPEYLALQGGSNGGLLVGAVVNQRPDLFAVGLPAVGVLDMLRYQHFTIGRYWATDYGTSEDSKEMFEYLYKYSPLHTIKEGVEYPAILVTTGDHDDRVVPAHSFKYAATLQEKYSGENPVMIRIETQAGHGAGKPTSKVIDEIVDEWAFMFYNMGVEPKFE
ncbi:prolyl oligopeptidase family serine peptidase [Odoribacter sp. OttesenSCG-928-L07]|nr:prolyl oligopeptidase family serine peptidase [Odoribacter sp. OttesenSCG-928-L07]MDL2238880.1 prolyl oligopeptidase family serine peptidase [Bacteroidales bacterium OttesenSCG-928-L14]MDL2240620.1 prolyl oligopeptidase family serine peptidase [Bacteroidales bacterium OttesenSCG-928-K22]